MNRESTEPSLKSARIIVDEDTETKKAFELPNRKAQKVLVDGGVVVGGTSVCGCPYQWLMDRRPPKIGVSVG